MLVNWDGARQASSARPGAGAASASTARDEWPEPQTTGTQRRPRNQRNRSGRSQEAGKGIMSQDHVLEGKKGLISYISEPTALMLGLLDLTVFLSTCTLPSKKGDFISFSKYKYINIKKREMKTVSEKKKTGNGTEECVTCPFLFSSACGATHQGRVLLPAAESCHAGAGNAQTKGQNPCGSSAGKPPPCSAAKAGRKSPLSSG